MFIFTRWKKVYKLSCLKDELVNGSVILNLLTPFRAGSAKDLFGQRDSSLALPMTSLRAWRENLLRPLLEFFVPRKARKDNNTQKTQRKRTGQPHFRGGFPE